MSGIYVHIPFCKQACYYCDFHFSTNLSLKEDLVSAMIREIEMNSSFFGSTPVDSIYFGGGTPSILSIQHLHRILELIQTYFNVNSDAELTLEANPDDLQKKSYITGLKEIGINRLSIGIQSFDDRCLRELNRAHDSQMSFSAVSNVRECGFENLNLDLIFSLPFLNHEKFAYDLETMIKLAPEHISTYSLTIEDKTVFGHRSRNGELAEIDEEESANQYEIIMDQLGSAGYLHYEISNFSKPGFESRHNMGYWKYEKYLGLGPGAHSFDGEKRWENVRNNASYIKSLSQDLQPREMIQLTDQDRINEYILTAMRTSHGLNFTDFERMFNMTLEKSQKDAIGKYEKSGLLETFKERVALTKSGKLLADEIAMNLFI